MRAAVSRTSWMADSVAEPNDAEFVLFRDLIERAAGIHLADTKRALLHGRLVKRIRDLGLSSFGAYHERVTQDDCELERMLDCIATNETSFFREPAHFEYLERTLLPEWARSAPRTLRVLSAGCSTGEEPFSLAMTLLAQFPITSGFTVEITAIDISTRVLESARRATWPIERSRQIPRALLKQFMLQGVGHESGNLRASRALRDVVEFRRANLNGELPVSGPFDLVFCRNVLIYFSPARKQHIVGQLSARLAPHGRLFLGHAETVHGFVDRLRCVRPTIYALSGAE